MGDRSSTLVKFKEIARFFRNILYFLVGVVIYLGKKHTPAFAYQSMVSMFCFTRGRSNDLINKIISRVSRRYNFTKIRGVLGDLNHDNYRQQVLKNLNEQGYHVFEHKLSEAICNELLAYATTEPCSLRVMDNCESVEHSEVYNRKNPKAVRYDFIDSQLLNNPCIQNLLADETFYVIAQDYLQCKPILDVMSLWWHTAYSNEPDKNAAQYYHFDMDRPKWLKFFIYLTDVGADNGPHSFVAGSHKTGVIPEKLLKKGYARLTDEEVASCFKKEDFIEFTAPRGTIIAEDTRGLHKGKHVKEEDRLILQFQFSNSLFGGEYPKAWMPEKLENSLSEKVKAYPVIFKAYL